VREKLDVIADSSRRMSRLIDDLLEFSRMSRTELHSGRVELDALVRDAVAGLEMQARGRSIDWHIEPLPAVRGDRPMLRQLYSNLISNAIKYTEPRERARVEIGAAGEADGRVILFVRDNGVGFDMRYAGRLFGLFQRLHRAQDFEGTGIGLANVHRIVTRHGGRIWAQAEPERGATFFFTLEPYSGHPAE
jgi:signal transduction histidine kinase